MDPELPQLAATTFTLLTTVVVLFQLALAGGAPWGELAMGGQFPGKFPTSMRIAALFQGALLAVLCVIVLIRAEMTLPHLYDVAEVGIWVVVVVLAVSLVMNLVTPSKKERMLWAPVVAVQFVCSIVVAFS